MSKTNLANLRTNIRELVLYSQMQRLVFGGCSKSSAAEPVESTEEIGKITFIFTASEKSRFVSNESKSARSAKTQEEIKC